MKILKILTLALVVLTLAACGSSYNDEKSQKLVDTFTNKGELSPEQWEEAVEQYCGYMDKSMEILKEESGEKDQGKLLEKGMKFTQENQGGFHLMLIVAGNMEDMPENCRNKVKEYNKNMEKEMKKLSTGI